MFEKYMQELEKRLKKWVNNWIKILAKSIEDKSPIDTGEYIDWNKEREAQKEWDKIVGYVYNNSENAQEVEFWFRGTPVNRHKNRRQWWKPIFNGVGARVFSRTSDEYHSIIKNTLINKIKKW